MVLICSEPGSCLSAEISHSNVLHSRAVATARCWRDSWRDLQVHPAPGEVADMHPIHPKWLFMLKCFVCILQWILDRDTEQAGSICWIHEGQRHPKWRIRAAVGFKAAVWVLCWEWVRGTSMTEIWWVLFLFTSYLFIYLFLPPDSPPTRMTQASSVFFGSQDLGRDCSFLKPLASTPGNKTLPIGEALFFQHTCNFPVVLPAHCLVNLYCFIWLYY